MQEKKILLVEDDDFLRELYLDLLLHEGYSVTTAEDGKIAFVKIRQEQWDLVLMDMILPGMGGLEVVKKTLQETQEKPYKHLVFMTNMYSDDQQKEALQIGDAYLVKIQMTPDVFVEEIKKHL